MLNSADLNLKFLGCVFLGNEKNIFISMGDGQVTF